VSAYSTDFFEYARRQHEMGAEAARRHTPEETGCCSDCGRVFPCEPYEHGLMIQEHYSSWIGDRSSVD
jgi:hypothetical protein